MESQIYQSGSHQSPLDSTLIKSFAAMSTVPGSSSEKPMKIEQEPVFFSEKQLYQIYDVTPISDGDALALKGNKFVVDCNVCKFSVASKVDPRLQDCVSFQKHALMHKEQKRGLQHELERDIKRTVLSASSHKANKENLKTICEPARVDTLEDYKDDHSTNTLFSDTPESKQPGGDGGLRKGYVMVCWFCASDNCGSGVYHPVRMRCYVCHEHGKHLSRNCPTGRYRGPPMPERYACSNWDH